MRSARCGRGGADPSPAAHTRQDDGRGSAGTRAREPSDSHGERERPASGLAGQHPNVAATSSNQPTGGHSHSFAHQRRYARAGPRYRGTGHADRDIKERALDGLERLRRQAPTTMREER